MATSVGDWHSIDSTRNLGTQLSAPEVDGRFPAESVRDASGGVTKRCWGIVVRGGAVVSIKVWVDKPESYRTEISACGAYLAVDVSWGRAAEECVKRAAERNTRLPVHVIHSGMDFDWGDGEVMGFDNGGISGRRRVILKRVINNAADDAPSRKRPRNDTAPAEVSEIAATLPKGRLITPRSCRVDGVVYDSRTEGAWSLFFAEMGVAFTPDCQTFTLRDTRHERCSGYMPDFHLTDLGLHVEVKGARPTMDEWGRAERLCLQHCVDVLLLYGSPLMGTPTPERGHCHPDAPRGLLWRSSTGERIDDVVWVVWENGKVGVDRLIDASDARARHPRLVAAYARCVSNMV